MFIRTGLGYNDYYKPGSGLGFGFVYLDRDYNDNDGGGYGRCYDFGSGYGYGYHDGGGMMCPSNYPHCVNIGSKNEDV